VDKLRVLPEADVLVVGEADIGVAVVDDVEGVDWAHTFLLLRERSCRGIVKPPTPGQPVRDHRWLPVARRAAPGTGSSTAAFSSLARRWRPARRRHAVGRDPLDGTLPLPQHGAELR